MGISEEGREERKQETYSTNPRPWKQMRPIVPLAQTVPIVADRQFSLCSQFRSSPLDGLQSCILGHFLASHTWTKFRRYLGCDDLVPSAGSPGLVQTLQLVQSLKRSTY